MATIKLTKSQSNMFKLKNALKSKEARGKVTPHCKHLNNYEPKFRTLVDTNEPECPNYGKANNFYDKESKSWK